MCTLIFHPFNTSSNKNRFLLAGSIVAGPSIEIAGWKNIDRNKVKLTDLTGLNLVPIEIFPHYKEKFIDLVQDESKKVNYPVVALTDEQAVLFEDDSYRIVG